MKIRELRQILAQLESHNEGKTDAETQVMFCGEDGKIQAVQEVDTIIVMGERVPVLTTHAVGDHLVKCHFIKEERRIKI